MGSKFERKQDSEPGHEYQKTIETYDRSARQLAEYFRSIPARVEDIEIAFGLIDKKQDPNVIEIGSADGRDAKPILQRTKNYIGIDASSELVKLARANLPEAQFKVADARNFNYPDNLDLVFAFASLIHLNRKDLRVVLSKLCASLNEGGVIYLSMKKGEKYSKYIKRDEFGERLFYLYTQAEIIEAAGPNFETVYAKESLVTHTDTEWLEMALKKSDQFTS